ncbi:MAG: hypothetical protein RL198_1034, partial [Actinomycetota bacterium]
MSADYWDGPTGFAFGAGFEAVAAGLRLAAGLVAGLAVSLTWLGDAAAGARFASLRAFRAALRSVRI